MRTRDVVIATVCVLAGCVFGAQSGQLSAQTAPTFAPSPYAPRGQQRCELLAEETYGRADTPLVRALGAEGWQVVAMNNFQVCFRRPVP